MRARVNDPACYQIAGGLSLALRAAAVAVGGEDYSAPMTDPLAEAAREYRKIIPELIAFQNDYEGGLLKPNYHKVAHIAHGWYRRVVRGVEAVLVLERAGFVGEASPLRRSILEHNVALSWLVEEGDGILDPIARGHKYSVEKLRDALEEGGWNEERLAQFQDALESVGDRDNKKDNLLQFATRVSRYGTVDEAMQVILETGQSHATYESAIQYFDPETKEVTEFAERVSDQAGFAARQMAQGIAQYISIFVNPPHIPELIDLTIRMREIDRSYRLAKGLPIPEQYGEDEHSPIPGMYDEDKPEQQA